MFLPVIVLLFKYLRIIITETEIKITEIKIESKLFSQLEVYFFSESESPSYFDMQFYYIYIIFTLCSMI